MHPRGAMTTMAGGYRKGVRGYRERLITGVRGVVNAACSLARQREKKAPRGRSCKLAPECMLWYFHIPFALGWRYHTSAGVCVQTKSTRKRRQSECILIIFVPIRGRIPSYIRGRRCANKKHPEHRLAECIGITTISAYADSGLVSAHRESPV